MEGIMPKISLEAFLASPNLFILAVNEYLRFSVTNIQHVQSKVQKNW